MELPQVFCWTRIGPESGEAPAAILARKEAEAVRNGGVFLWGIGNSIGRAIPAMLARTDALEVLFSPIRSSPRRCDTDPAAVVAWTRGRAYDGQRVRLPEHSVVVSRAEAGALPRKHYALVCRVSPSGLRAVDGMLLPMRGLVNLISRRRVGASQVTAIVELLDEAVNHDGVAGYPVVARARLEYPYVVILEDPVIVPRAMLAECAGSPEKAAAALGTWLAGARIAAHDVAAGLPLWTTTA